MVDLKLMFNFQNTVMDDVNYDIINLVEEKCFNGASLTENEINYYLTYICFEVRKKLAFKSSKELAISNFSFECDTAQSIIVNYLKKLNVLCNPIQTEKAISAEIIGHSFVVAQFLVNEERKSYLIDPTYNQFFDSDKCQEKEFMIVNGIVVKTPDPGYFILKEGNQEKIRPLLENGFLNLSEENAKIYGDSFYKTKVGISQDYMNNLTLPGKIYIKCFKNSDKLTYSNENLENLNLSLDPIYHFPKQKTV